MNKEAFNFKKFLGQLSGGVDTVMNPVPSAELPFSPTAAVAGLGTMAKVLPSPVSPILTGVSAIGELAGLGANGMEGTLNTLSKKYEAGGPVTDVFTGLKQPIGSLLLGGKKLVEKLKYDPTVGFPNSEPTKGMGYIPLRRTQPTTPGRPQTYASEMKGGQRLLSMNTNSSPVVKTGETALDLLVKASREYAKKKKEKRRLDPKCWEGYRKDGTKLKDGVRVNDCVKVGGLPFEFLLKAATDPTLPKFNLLGSLSVNPNHPADRRTYDSTIEYDKPLNWEKLMQEKITKEPFPYLHPALVQGSDDLEYYGNPENRRRIEELRQHIYHGDKSNMNSSMLVEGAVGKRNPYTKGLASKALRANPYNSVFLDVHAGGEPNQYRMEMDTEAMPTDEQARIRAGGAIPWFGPGHLRKALGDKNTNVHNLYFAGCNLQGGCGPTPQILAEYPDATNIVAHPPGKIGWSSQLLRIGLGLEQPRYIHDNVAKQSLLLGYGAEQTLDKTDPLQYLKGTNGTWTTNKFRGFPPQRNPDGTWTPGTLSEPRRPDPTRTSPLK